MLRRKTRKIWPDRETYPTLKSLRHQFVSNAKANGVSPVRIAAMMGHSDDRTAQSHYGYRMKGEEGGFPIKPLQKEVNRVQQHLPEDPSQSAEELNLGDYPEQSPN